MAKTLVAYFSATGTTKEAAKAVAKALNADIEEIAPAVPYTAADLNWNNPQSRSSIEMNDSASSVELAGTPGDLSGYDTVLLGYPIWWYTAPHIITTWVKAADLAGKRIITFATSGGSGMCTSTADVAKLAPDATWKDGRILHGGADAQTWARSLEL